MTHTALTAARDHLVHALEADLIGPFRRGLPPLSGSPEFFEELQLPPSRWYLTGFLTPEAQRDEHEEANEELAQGSDTNEEETGGSSPDPKKRNFMPASMGLTVFVPDTVTELSVVVRYADYERVDEDPPREEHPPQDLEADARA